MSKSHHIDIPSKGWTITCSMSQEERRLLKDDIEELISESNNLAEDSLYQEGDTTALCTATMRLTEAMQSLVSAIL
mgnify:CR=1 FL=1|jgi:hypothetical protein